MGPGAQEKDDKLGGTLAALRERMRPSRIVIDDSRELRGPLESREDERRRAAESRLEGDSGSCGSAEPVRLAALGAL